ncbi:MAG: O-antigen ligase family protein [Bacteroidota bacterium]
MLYPFFFFLIPFDVIHLFLGVDLKTFLVSNLLFLSTYIFVATFSYFITHYDIRPVMKQLLVFNFILTLLAIPLYFTPWKELVWYVNNFTLSVKELSRLSLFTFESSYYALLFVPVAFYYLLKVFFRQNKTAAFVILLMVALPLLLSLSLGVLAAMLLTFISLFVLDYKKILYRENYFFTISGSVALCCVVLLVLFIFYPDNPVFVRVANILQGNDSSARGRIADSFSVAWRVAGERSIWFGAGLGQVKILVYDIVKKYFNHWGEMEVYRIPNSVAETLAIFGITGIVLRFSLIFYLFFKTRVLSNYYRTALFIFIFIYQFTGSFITNIAEYVIWALAFSHVFPQYNLQVPEPKTTHDE